MKKIHLKGDPCSTWLAEGRVICHEAVTEDGKNYYCAHCGVTLKASNVIPITMRRIK